MKAILENNEHQLIFEYDGEEIISYVQLKPHKNFFHRLWVAIKHIFGYSSRYGTVDEYEITVEQAQQLLNVQTKFQDNMASLFPG